MPAAIGALILTAVGIADVVIIAGVTLSTIVGTVVITGALIGLQFLLPKPGLPKQDGSQPLRQTIPPRVGAYGRVRISGTYMLYEEHVGGSFDVLALVSGKITGYVAYYLHDDLVTLDVNGFVNAGVDNRYAGQKVLIKTRLGEDTETAYGEIVASLASDVWTNDHRGDGIASLALLCASTDADKFQETYPHGLPEPSVVLDGYQVWDPRVTGHDRHDPSTWAFSTNPVLQLLDYITHPDHGMGLSYEDLIEPVIDEWIEEANQCDQLVSRIGGTHKRYESNGWYTFDTKPEDVIGVILSSCDGWLAERGDGTLALKVGVYRAPTAPTIEAKHVLGFSVNYGTSDEERVNELTLSFISPPHDYRDTPLTPWRDEADISETGKVRTQGLTMGWVQSYPQVRRLAKRAMVRLNPTMRGSFVTTLFGMSILGERWIRLQYPFVSGLEDAIVEISKADIDLMEGRIAFDWVKINPNEIDAWDPDTEEGPAPPVPDKLSKNPFVPPENLYSFIEGGDLIVTLDNDGGVQQFRAQYRYVGDAVWISTTQQTAEDDDNAGRWVINFGPVPTDAPIEVQVARVATLSTVSSYEAAPFWEYDDLGAKLVALWDADRDDLITDAGGGAVSSWLDVVGGYDATQSTSGSRPTYSATALNGNPALVFDGTDDCLLLSSFSPWPFPATNAAGEMWGLAKQDAAAADATARIIASLGGAASGARQIRRNVVSAVNRAQALSSNVTSTDAVVDFSGAHVVRGVVTTTGVAVAINTPTLPTEAAVTSNTATTRLRIGASSAAGAADFWNGSIALVAFTQALTDFEASSFARYLRGRR